MNKMVKRLMVLAMLIALCVLPTAGFAATHTVGSGDSLATTIANASSGDVIKITADLAGENVTIDKSLTITGNNNVTLNNVVMTVQGANVELTVSNLKFTGNSYINANNGKALTVTGCDANVTPSKAGNNGRAAFIVTGTSELNNQPLLLTVKNNQIIASKGANDKGDVYAAAVFGWRYLADGTTISNNTFGSKGTPYTFVAVKLMNAMPDAGITLENNSIYGTTSIYYFTGFDLYQNNSRNNDYTVIAKNNKFYFDPETNGSYYSAAYYLEGNKETNVTLMDSGSVIYANGSGNSRKLTIDDIDDNDLASDYDKFYGVNVKTNSSGKITGGTFGGDKNVLLQALAEGYTLEGETYYTVVPVNGVISVPGTATPSTDLPKTGDESNLMLFALLLAMSAAGVLLLRRRSANR